MLNVTNPAKKGWEGNFIRTFSNSKSPTGVFGELLLLVLFLQKSLKLIIISTLLIQQHKGARII